LRNVNLTNVRSAIATMLALLIAALGVLAGPGAPAAPATAAEREPRVTIAILPRGTTTGEIAAASPRISPGTMSAGLGPVPSAQTYLDIGQGNRLFSSLYPEPLPVLPVRRDGVPIRAWDRQLERAAGAPAAIESGLLAGRLRESAVPFGARPATGGTALIAVGPDGGIERPEGCTPGRCPGVTVEPVDLSQLSALVARLRPRDLLIAIERAPPLRRLLAIGIAGAGFEGNLRSPNTRIDGYVLSTDIAPTILEHYGLPVPKAMSGRPIASTGRRDLAAIATLQERLREVVPRRTPVIAVNLVVWIGLAALAALLFRRRGAAVALNALAVSVALVPALLLLTAALAPSVGIERLVVGIGAPVLALAALLALAGRFGERAGFAAFALAAAVSVGATAIDMLAGSPLTARSLIGPNPEGGVRFYGIGNELEAVIGSLLPLGSGAAVAAARPADPRRAVAVVAAVAALLGVLVFAPGRFGADVGAAITFPAGAAGVVVAALGGGRRRLSLLVAVPLVAVIGLVAIDIALGGDAHLSRSVLDAGGLEGLGQVVERRLTLAARSFEQFVRTPSYTLAAVLIVAGVIARRRVLGWFDGLPAARAGFIGGIVAAVVGALSNDSGALLLLVGTAYLVAFSALAVAFRFSRVESG
jgi:hypothetical protein